MNLLSHLDQESLHMLQDVGRLADARGIKAYLVGGPVRDLILEQPLVDIDVVVVGNAMTFAKSLAMTIGAEVKVYPAFKTATLTLKNGRHLDVVTARKETYARPGAFPNVVPDSIESDLFRRDFTINAIAISLNTGSWADVVDPYGGIRDLQSKKVRVLHDKSFMDDPTRMLRAIRFMERLGFSLESQTAKLLVKAISANALATITPQRYKKEYDKILTEPESKRMLASVEELGAIQGKDHVTHRKS